LKSIKITNPDCPDIGWTISVKRTIEEQEQISQMVMVDFANSDQYKKGKEITSFLESNLFEIQQTKEDITWKIVGSDLPKLPPGIDPLSNGTVPKHQIEPHSEINYLQLTGSNTFYITHPEEIMADNVAILTMFLSGYDIDEVTERGLEILSKVSEIFGDETHQLFLQCVEARESKSRISQRQKKKFMEKSINAGARKRKKIEHTGL